MGLADRKRGDTEVSLMMAADYRELRLFLTTGKYDKPGLSQGGAGYIMFCFVFAHIVSSAFNITFMAFFTSVI